ncbi:transposase [Streptomyces scopuliridis]|uniref:transposase n=1 Tax=Streptomyces scopuliridis TaxID=452529 RepID=UPI0036C7B0E5
MEGVHRPRARRQARPHRARPGEPPPTTRSPPTSPVPWVSAPPAGPAGPGKAAPTGCRRPTTSPTASSTSTAATRSATTTCGPSTATAKGAANTPAALKYIRAALRDSAPIYVILDNPSAHKGAKIRAWVKKNKAELCFTPTNASWANSIDAHSGPLRQFTMTNSHDANHTVQTRTLHACSR